MIYSGQIRRTLVFLNSQYDEYIGGREQIKPMMYSKLAILEYCGWLEETFDEIARNCVRHKQRTFESRKDLESQISRTTGFAYKNSGRKLLCSAIGIVRLLEIEKVLERNGELSLLQSNLGAMNEQRRRAAHTSTRGVTQQYIAPSVTIQNFNRTEPILQKMWSLVRYSQ